MIAACTYIFLHTKHLLRNERHSVCQYFGTPKIFTSANTNANAQSYQLYLAFIKIHYILT